MIYNGLHFQFNEIKNEIISLSKLAKPFIREECHYILSSWSNDLATISTLNTTNRAHWLISESNPICTVTTREYEPGSRRGGHDIWGEMTFVWEINRVSTSNVATKGHMCLSGNASTKIKICEIIDGQRTILAQWQIEVGVHDSPGWHFHVGLCNEGNTTPFPHWLPVPRVPGMLALPSDSLDFLLGEIFQERWRQTVVKDCHETVTLGKAQLKRLKNLSSWQNEAVNSGNGSCWNRLKHAKPPADLFLR